MTAAALAKVLRLRRAGQSYAAIARAVGLRYEAVRRACVRHFGRADVRAAQDTLAQEIAAVRRERATAPLYRYRWWAP